jgi:hypothetical protein
LAAAAILSLGITGGAYAAASGNTERYLGGATASTARAQVQAQDCTGTDCTLQTKAQAQVRAGGSAGEALSGRGSMLQQHDQTCDGTCDATGDATADTLRQHDRLQDGTCDGTGAPATTGGAARQRLGNSN